MDLADLTIFRTVVEAGGITRAAEKLHRVQSNVTTRIRQLEQDLGADLFVRQGRKLHVSPAGSILLDYANRLLALADEARDAVQDRTPRGTLRLGAMESTAAARLPKPISSYHRRYPAVRLELQTGNPQQLAGRILAGALDAALVAEPVAPELFDSLPIYNEEVVIVAAADHPPITSAEGASPIAILAFEHGCGYRKRLEDWFARSGRMPDRVIEVSSYHAILGCVVAGMGIALMPRIVLDSFSGKDQVSIHRLPRDADHARTLLIWRKGTQSAKVAALAEVLTEEQQVGAAKTRRK